jgi:hypothetical protein
VSEKSIADKHHDELLAAGIINVPREKMGWTQVPHSSEGSSAAVSASSVSASGSEVRIVDPQTGGTKGSKLARFDLIPGEFETALAEHYGRGARKYEDRNWERGYKWGLSYAALRRHLAAWVAGESLDPETGSHHLVAVAWHCIALYYFERHNLGKDDLRGKRSVADAAGVI